MANSVFDPCPAASRTASFLLPAVPSAIREGRRRVGTTLFSWGLSPDEDSSWSLTVVCGELLARAVRRAAGGPAGRLAVGVDLEGDQLIVDVLEVLDGTPPSARVRADPPDAHGEDGWALALVGAHCTAHGTEHTPAGPRCWAVVTLPAGAFPGPSPALARPENTRWVVEPAGAALAAAGSRVVRMGKENVPYT
ncbi:ATP-binding protein [Streptomyces sp. AD681]|uniref:ATP-binding protein n=1 Tax=Streptomyces sp. AD681 TaxID=3019069 RepID=UPI0022F1528E|nr:ATP-binding protein [Streptomyces sp. AD681]MDA5145176.1 ATP-binding protein [Streptomyces sp. AD681]